MLNLKDYLHYLDALNISEAEKEDILRIIYPIVEAEVDRAFGLHTVQLACAQSENKPSQTRQKSIDSKGSPLSSRYHKAANDNLNPQQKGQANG